MTKALVREGEPISSEAYQWKQIELGLEDLVSKKKNAFNPISKDEIKKEIDLISKSVSGYPYRFLQSLKKEIDSAADAEVLAVLEKAYADVQQQYKKLSTIKS